MTTLIQSRPFFTALQEWVLSATAKISHRRAQHAEMCRVFNELNALSERELTDIGISRVSIREVAIEAGRMI